ncbi:MAG: ImmA/IrrE family metallo-endopeptidase [Acetobacteraceae bacterium]|nr:ImmA/IrrE family metallo-endopeptidase [Acetobacteraceae bacterium]
MNAASFEVNLARRVIERFNLSPPVDVESVAYRYAMVEHCPIPLQVDGICLNLKRPGIRPTIIVNLDRPLRRRRFTLAHELGHVLIPWHRGSLYDDFSLSDRERTFDRWEMEGEANRFASELLMPSDWISEVQTLANNFGRAVSWVQEQAEVSMIASAIRLIGIASANHIFAHCDDTGFVLNSGRSPGTLANAPAWNEDLDRSYLDGNAADRGEILAGGTCLYWWRFPDEVALAEPNDPRDWRSILQEIIDDLVAFDNDKPRVRQSINGVIGATNSSRRGSSAEELLAALMQRFDSKRAQGGIFPELPRHPNFRDFLIRRVKTLRGVGP